MILRKYRSKAAALVSAEPPQTDPSTLLKRAEKIGRDLIVQKQNDVRCLQLVASRLRKSPTMTKIDMRGCDVSKTDAVSLVRKILRDSPCVAALDLSWISLGDPRASSLCEAIQNSGSVRELVLSGNDLGSGDNSSYLGDFLRTNSSVEKLYLGNNALCMTTVEGIARGLRENSTLQELDLWNCCIGDEAGAKILESARYSKSLKVLRLNMNRLGKRSLLAATRLLETPTALTVLNLDSNPHLFGRNDMSEEAFTRALEMNRNLLSLGVPYTGVTDYSAKLFFEAVTINDHLEYLDVGYNEIQKEGYSKMLETIPKMKTLKHLRTHARAQLVSSDALSRAMEKNTSLHHFTSICVGCNKVWSSLRRNQVLSRANRYVMAETDTPLSLLPKAMHKLASEKEGGTTATFVMLERYFR